jgi:hypothetical protein
LTQKYKRSDFVDSMDRINALPPERLAKVKEGAARIIAESHLSEIRKALKRTQKDLSAAGGMKQAEISRIERNPETVQVRTLERYVKSLGGELQLVARFPDGTSAEIPLRAGKPIAKRARMLARPDGKAA